MECPYCNAELIHKDTWGYLASHQSGEVLGQIYICPNADGFETQEETNDYLETTEESLEDLGLVTWEELVCESANHHVSGSFYTDKNDNLKEGYPC